MHLCAVVAQLVERKLPKLEVASSNLVRRFCFMGPDVALRQGNRGGGRVAWSAGKRGRPKQE